MAQAGRRLPQPAASGRCLAGPAVCGGPRSVLGSESPELPDEPSGHQASSRWGRPGDEAAAFGRRIERGAGSI